MDRFLLNDIWFDSGYWLVKSLGRKQSDHKALILSAGEKDWGPKPFKIFNWWLEEDSLKRKINNFWVNRESGQDKDIQLVLKEVKGVMKEWGKSAKSELDYKI